MEEQLAGVLEWLKTRADGTEKFILEQAPLYVQEVLAWTFFGGLVGCIASMAFTLVFVALTVRVAKEDRDGLPTIGCLVLVLTGIAFTCGFACDAAKSKIAPRVVIVEHLKGQAQKSK